MSVCVCARARMCEEQTVERCRRPLGSLTLRSLVAFVALTPALSFIWSVQCIFPLTILWPSHCCWEPRLKHTIIVDYMLEEARLSPCLSGCSSASSLRPFFAQNDESRQCFYPFHPSSFCGAVTIPPLILILSALYVKMFRQKLEWQYLTGLFVRFSSHFVKHCHPSNCLMVFVCFIWFIEWIYGAEQI